MKKKPIQNKINNLHKLFQKKDIDTFDNFTKYLDGLKNTSTNNAIKGKLFEEFILYLFMFHPLYSTTVKDVWLFEDVPIKVIEKLQIPKKDNGIDLIILDNYGEYHAVQCKYRTDRNTTVPWNELATFMGLTFGTTEKFARGFYVTNTYNITPNVRNSKRITPIYGEFFDNELDEKFFSDVKCHLSKKQQEIIMNVKKPWPHQWSIIIETLAHFENNDIGHLEACCGSGKTLTSFWIDRYTRKNKLTIITVPSLQLLTQFYKDWANQMAAEQVRYHFILVGSDADTNGEDVYYNNGLILTTDEKEISKKIKRINRPVLFEDMEIIEKIVVLTTYQSADKLMNALNKMEVLPDMCIFDEAHQTVGHKGKQFSLMLSDENIKITKRFFMTATPKMYKPKKIKTNMKDANEEDASEENVESIDDNENENICEDDEDDFTIISMDNKNIYGECIYKYNLGQAINNDVLCDYEICTLITNDKAMRKNILENKLVKNKDLKNIYDSHELACASVLLKTMAENINHHLVTYHNSIAASKKFRELLNILKEKSQDTKKIEVFQIDGNLSVDTRNKIFRKFIEADYAILTNSKVLREGININVIDSICFVDPKSSAIDIQQCSGRALRKHVKKEKAKLFVPIMVDDINSIDDSTVYGNLISVLKNLSSSDYRILEYFEAVANGKVVDRNMVKHRNYTGEEFTPEEIKILEDWMSKINVNIWKKINGWLYNYNRLIKWVEEHKRMPNKRSENGLEKELGWWCENQKQRKKKGLLSEDKAEKLEKINGWQWEFVISFEETFNKVNEYAEKYGRLPSMKSKDVVIRKLGRWCDTQRQRKKKNQLTAEEIQLLETIKGWYWEGIALFEEIVNKINEYAEKYGRLPSTKSKDVDIRNLAQWCANQRQRKKRNQLAVEKIQLLETIKEWYWENNTKSFIELVEDIKNYVNVNNKLPTESSEDKTTRSMGVWLRNQREKYRKNKLTDEHIEQLKSIPSFYFNNDEKKAALTKQKIIWSKD